MKIKVMKECGYEEALQGLALSYNSYPSGRVATNLAFRQGGHNKFLESMQVWLDVTAPRYWWSQADTYRLSTKQSESTMHTIMRRGFTDSDFEGEMDELILSRLNEWMDDGEFEVVKRLLPESFLQRRIWNVNYKCLQNIIYQRETHKLKEWEVFIDEIGDSIEHPTLLFKDM